MNTFPLHRLPNKELIYVLKSLEIYDQLTYSLCSKKTKKAIKSLNLEAHQINFNVTDTIGIEIRVENLISTCYTTEHDNIFPNNRIIAHGDIDFIFIDINGKRTDWKRNFGNFELKKWLDHFCEILHHSRIDELFFNDENINENCIEPIQKVIGGLRIGHLTICEQITNDFAKKALESFPNYEELYLNHIPFENHEVHKIDKYLIQNLKYACIPGAQRLIIDQVLLTNSQKIQLNSSSFDEKDLNRLLKLWIRGTNPRLKHFYTCGKPQPGNDLLVKNVILKGIKHEQVPMDSQEMYREHRYEDYYKETKLAGGSRIRRYDGTIAVVLIGLFEFELIVDV